MMELLNVESAKSGKNHGWLGLQRSKPVYTPLSRRDWVRAAPRHPLTRPEGLVFLDKRRKVLYG